MQPKRSHVRPFFGVCELNFYLVAFLQVHDHYCFGNKGTVLDIIADEISPFFFTRTVFLFLPVLSLV